jgi:hypothetical protein
LKGTLIAGTRYASYQATAQRVRSFHQKESVMLKVELHNRYTNGDPAARFATATEIEIAEKLRHQLEERYLAPSALSSPLHVRSGNDR